MASTNQPVGVEVEGWKEFQRQLKQMGPEAEASFKRVNVAVAESVRQRATAKASQLGGVAKKAAPSMRTTNTKNYSSIRLGDARHPFAQGAEFGAFRYRQFKAWRGNGNKAGYFLQPTIRDMAPEIERKYDEALSKVAAGVFPDS